MGGLQTNYHGEVVARSGSDPDKVVPGLMAVGEAACVSVHGANRLGSNSLIDLVVFGRAAGLRCAEIVDRGAAPTLPKDAGDAHLARFDRFRNAKGKVTTAKAARHDAGRDASRLRRVPHRRDAAGWLPEDRRSVPGVARYRRDGPLDDLEFRSGRDAWNSRT